MSRFHVLMDWVAGLALAYAGMGTMEAAAEEARPVIVLSGTPTYPEKISWLSDAQRKGLS